MDEDIAPIRCILRQYRVFFLAPFFNFVRIFDVDWGVKMAKYAQKRLFLAHSPKEFRPLHSFLSVFVCAEHTGNNKKRFKKLFRCDLGISKID